jgi:hypothetical protein
MVRARAFLEDQTGPLPSRKPAQIPQSLLADDYLDVMLGMVHM